MKQSLSILTTLKLSLYQNKWVVVALLFAGAYPFAVNILHKQSPFMIVSVGMPLNMLVVFGVMGWYVSDYSKRHKLSKRQKCALDIGSFLLLVVIMRMVGFKTIFG